VGEGTRPGTIQAELSRAFLRVRVVFLPWGFARL
jgi:hypothetical protein